MPLSCPRCDCTLSECSFGATSVDGCTSCGGLWFDTQELNKLTRDPSAGLMEVERAFQRVLLASGGGDMQCPRCEQPLREFSFPHTPNVTLDACPSCKGIWVDDGELGAIAQRIADHQQSTSGATHADTVRLQARTLTGFLLSSLCPKCQTSNPASSLICWACGDSLKARGVYHLCPRCNQPLEERSCGTTSETKVDVCLLCTGVWMEAGEVSAFCQLGFEAINDVQSTLTRHQTYSTGSRFQDIARCPACHSDMVTQTYGSRRTVQADRCSRCRSLWLDAGELLGIVELVQSGDFMLESARTSDAWADAQ